MTDEAVEESPRNIAPVMQVMQGLGIHVWHPCRADADANMAGYKTIDTSPKFLPVVLSEQQLRGTFEHALNRLLDHELDLRP